MTEEERTKTARDIEGLQGEVRERDMHRQALDRYSQDHGGKEDPSRRKQLSAERQTLEDILMIFEVSAEADTYLPDLVD